MSYTAFLSAETERNRQQAYQYYLERSREGAYRWFVAYESAIDKLTADPNRLVVATENESYPVKLQQINFGTETSRPTHRMLFYVDGESVYVVTLRHLMQDVWRPADSTK